MTEEKPAILERIREKLKPENPADRTSPFSSLAGRRRLLAEILADRLKKPEVKKEAAMDNAEEHGHAMGKIAAAAFNDEIQKIGGVTSETLGTLGNSFLLAPVGIPASIAGWIAGLIAGNKSSKEILEQDKALFTNLIPGVGAYRSTRRGLSASPLARELESKKK